MKTVNKHIISLFTIVFMLFLFQGYTIYQFDDVAIDKLSLALFSFSPVVSLLLMYLIFDNKKDK